MQWPDYFLTSLHRSAGRSIQHKHIPWNWNSLVYPSIVCPFLSGNQYSIYDIRIMAASVQKLHRLEPNKLIRDCREQRALARSFAHDRATRPALLPDHFVLAAACDRARHSKQRARALCDAAVQALQGAHIKKCVLCSPRYHNPRAFKTHILLN